MNDDFFDLKQEHYFPLHFRLFGLALILVTVMSFINPGYNWLKYLLLVFFSVLAFVMLTTRYGLRIYLTDRNYMIYTWFFGMRKGELVSFKHIESFFITEIKGTKSVVRYSTGIPMKYEEVQYKAYIKLDDESKVHLDTDSSKHKLEGRLSRYKKELNSLQVKR